MSTEQNKAIARRFFELFNEGNLAAMGEVMAPDVIDHNPAPGQGPGLEGVNQILAAFRGGFPNMRVTVEDTIADGDLVVTRQVGRGTHTGEFLGIPPTGKPVSFTAMDQYRIVGGKVVEVWHIEDLLTLMQQLGVIPTPAA